MPVPYGIPMTKEQIDQLMAARGIRECDLEESFIRASGPGGQNVNKVATCVVLTHKLTGVSVKAQGERSQFMNRLRARELLLRKIEEIRQKAKLVKQQAVELKKRQNRKRPRALKEKILESKKKQAEKKGIRKKISIRDL